LTPIRFPFCGGTASSSARKNSRAGICRRATTSAKTSAMCGLKSEAPPNRSEGPQKFVVLSLAAGKWSRCSMQISKDHPHPPIWDLTSDDINRIKGQLQAHRVRIDAKYAEDSKMLDDEFAELETLERLAASVALKYRADNAPEYSEENSVKAGENGPPA